MQQFATVGDYTDLYGGAVDEKRLSAMLGHASAFLELELRRGRVTVSDTDAVLLMNLKRICCRVAHDLMQSDWGMSGATQATETAGSFSQSMTFGAPVGKMTLYRDEKRALGIRTGRVSSFFPYGGE